MQATVADRRYENMRRLDRELTEAIKAGESPERIAYLRRQFDTARRLWQKAETQQEED